MSVSCLNVNRSSGEHPVTAAEEVVFNIFSPRILPGSKAVPSTYGGYSHGMLFTGS